MNTNTKPKTVAKINSKGQKYLPTESPFKYWQRFIVLISKILLMTIVESYRAIIKLFKKIEPKNIDGQLALVTGGGNGLGKEICVELAKRGCNIAVIDIDLPNATKTADILINTYGVKAKAYKADVSSYDEIFELKSKIEKDLGDVDILINNAGLTPTICLDDSSPEYIRKIVDVNLLSNIWTVKVFLPGMKERRRGHILQIASIAGLTGVPIASVYSATKHGVRGFMESIFLDMIVENLEDVVRTTTVYPYFIATNDELCNFLEKNRYLSFFPAYTASKVAQITVDGLLTNKRKVVIPNFFNLAVASRCLQTEGAEIQTQKLLLSNHMFKANKKAKIIDRSEIDYNQNVTNVSSNVSLKKRLINEMKDDEKAIEHLAEQVVDGVLGNVVENVMGKVIDNVGEN